MQNLRDSDGTPSHRRAIRFHLARLRSGAAPLHAQLHTEAVAAYTALKTRERDHVDAHDDLADATAEVDSTEIAFEHAIRDLDNDLARLDRDNPGKGARNAIFPGGYGAVIDPERARQLEVLPDLHARIDPYKNEPALAAALAKLAATEQAFRDALDAEEAASEKEDALFTLELTARATVRAQLVSAHGRLRDLYKAQPSLAEGFFMKLGRREVKAKKKVDEPANPTDPTGTEEVTEPAVPPPAG